MCVPCHMTILTNKSALKFVYDISSRSTIISKMSPNVYKRWPKRFHHENEDFDTFKKLPKNVGKWGKIIVGIRLWKVAQCTINRPIWSHWLNAHRFMRNTFLKMGHSRPLFLYFRLFNTVESKQINIRYKSLPMTGLEPQTSGVGSDQSTNWATTTARDDFLSFLFWVYLSRYMYCSERSLFLMDKFTFGHLDRTRDGSNESLLWSTASCV